MDETFIAKFRRDMVVGALSWRSSIVQVAKDFGRSRSSPQHSWKQADIDDGLRSLTVEVMDSSTRCTRLSDPASSRMTLLHGTVYRNVPTTVDHLALLTVLAADLNDADVMAGAWA